MPESTVAQRRSVSVRTSIKRDFLGAGSRYPVRRRGDRLVWVMEIRNLILLVRAGSLVLTQEAFRP